MQFSILAIAALAVVIRAAPPALSQQTRQVRTASERLGLKWLGGNSTLPKILYAHALALNAFLLTLPVCCIREVLSPVAQRTEHSMTPNMANFQSPEKKS